MFRKDRKWAAFLAAFFAVLLFSLYITPGSNVYAAREDAPDPIKFLQNDDLYKKVSTWQHWWWLRGCFAAQGFPKNYNGGDYDNKYFGDYLSTSKVDGWDFFNKSPDFTDDQYDVVINSFSPLGGMYGEGTQLPSSDETILNLDVKGFRDCAKEKDVVEQGFSYLGFQNSRRVFCMFPGQVINHNRDIDETSCRVGADAEKWSNFSRPETLVDAFEDKVAKPGWPGSSGAYLRAYLTLTKSGCVSSFPERFMYTTSSEVPQQDDTDKYPVPIIVKKGNRFVVRYVLGVGNPRFVALVATTNEPLRIADQRAIIADEQMVTCDQLAIEAQATANAYVDYLQRFGVDSEQDGVQDQDPDGDDDEEGQTSCNVEGIGWIICPAMNFIADINDKAYGFLAGTFLEIDRELVGDKTEAAWKSFRDLANAAFVVAFIVIIYSQMTGAGITNYGIKKMLPKLIIAAILVNASFILCKIAVDVTNIVGNAIPSFFDVAFSTDTGSAPTIDNTDLPLWKDVIGKVLIAGLAVIGLALAFSFGLPGLLALVVIVLLLVARKAAIILLVVISPLAFVAYLLPNTESWFKKWWKMFSTLLMVYPVIGLVFGASALAAGILNDPNEINLQLTALAVSVIPLFAVPFLTKGAMSSLGAIGSKLASLSDRANRNATANIKKGRSGEALNAFKARRNLRQMNRRRGEGRLATWGSDERRSSTRRGRAAAWLGTRQKALDESAMGRYLGGDRGAASAVAGIHKEFDDNVKAQKALLSGRSNESLLQDLRDGKGSDEYQAAVAGTLMSRDHRESHLQALDVMRARNAQAERAGDRKAMSTVSSVQKQMADDMKDKPWALGDQATGQLVEGTYGRSTSTSGEDQRHFAEGIQEQLQERIGTKLSAKSLATMNPDEMKRIHAAAMNGDLTRDQIAQLRATIGDIRGNQQMNALVKPEAQAQFDQILGETLSDVANRAPNNAATQQEALDINARRDAQQQRRDNEGSLF